MTLILALGNKDQFIQLSDRRVSHKDNIETPDDEYNKAGVLVLANARFVFGFTGLAVAEDFRTQYWLLDALYESGLPDCTVPNVFRRLEQRATRDFRAIPSIVRLKPEDRRLSIMFSGYLYKRTGAMATCAILTNFETDHSRAPTMHAQEHFQWLIFNQAADGRFSFIQRIGMWPAMTHDDVACLRAFLEQEKPAEAIIGKGVEVLRSIADRTTAHARIGKQLTSICLPRDLDTGVTTEYHSDVVTWQSYMPDMVWLLGPGQRRVDRDMAFMPVDPARTRALVVPRVGRNTPCPCGSGMKYKHCHGRPRRARRCMSERSNSSTA